MQQFRTSLCYCTSTLMWSTHLVAVVWMVKGYDKEVEGNLMK